jgi:hypothetical protein
MTINMAGTVEKITAILVELYVKCSLGVADKEHVKQSHKYKLITDPCIDRLAALTIHLSDAVFIDKTMAAPRIKKFLCLLTLSENQFPCLKEPDTGSRLESLEPNYLQFDVILRTHMRPHHCSSLSLLDISN